MLAQQRPIFQNVVLITTTYTWYTTLVQYMFTVYQMFILQRSSTYAGTGYLGYRYSADIFL